MGDWKIFFCHLHSQTAYNVLVITALIHRLRAFLFIVKQVGKKSSQPDKNGFIATNYERVQLTYDEAVAFATSLKTIRKRILDAHEARTSELLALISALACNQYEKPLTTLMKQ